jgi:hypothetical protein
MPVVRCYPPHDDWTLWSESFAFECSVGSHAASFAACRASAIGSFNTLLNILYTGAWHDGWSDGSFFSMERDLQRFLTDGVPVGASVIGATIHLNLAGGNLGPWFFVPGDMVIVRAPLCPYDASSFGYLGGCNVELAREKIDWIPPTIERDIVLPAAFYPDVQQGVGAITNIGFRQGWDFDNTEAPFPGNSAFYSLLGTPPDHGGTIKTWLDVSYTMPATDATKKHYAFSRSEL